MWRYSIIVPKKFGQMVYRLKEVLKGKISSFTHAQIITDEGGYYKYFLILPLDKKDKLKSFILNYLSDNILSFYKKEFLTTSFNFSLTDELKMQSFVKALMCFDYLLDREYVFDQIKNYDCVYVDSLYRFGLKKLTNKWKDLTKLANENYYYFKEEETFLQLLKFLISNIDYKTSFVNVYFEGDKYKFFDHNNNVINDYFLDFPSASDAYLLSSLICLSPQKIKLHFNLEGNYIEHIIYNLFDERIEKA